MATERINIDCMKYMKECGDNSFDLGLSDPEQGLGQHGGTDRTHMVIQKNGSKLLCKDGGYKKKNWDEKPPPLEYFKELMRVTKNQIIWGVNYHPILLTGGRIIWDKVNDGSDQSDCEIAFCSLNNRIDIVRYMWRGMMQGLSIENGTIQQGNKKLNEKRIHPTQKPVMLYKWLLNNYAETGSRILDTHLGSGSSAIAAHQLGYDFVGTEIDKEYFDDMQERFAKATAQLAMF